MPHRDQAEAMRARIEALQRRLDHTEREAAEERARLEAELAEARKEARHRDSPAAGGEPETPAKRRSSRLLGIALLLALFALAAGWFVLVSVAFPSERIADLRVVTADDGADALFVSEVVGHATEDTDIDTSRLAVYDLATGERRSRRVVHWARGAGVTVLGRARDGVWAYEYSTGVVLLDAREGSVLRTTEELMSEAQRTQLLWAGELDDRVGYLAEEEKVVVTLRDGGRLLLGGEAPEPFQGELPPIPAHPQPSASTVHALESGTVLRLEAREGDDRHARRLQPAGARLLKGTFVLDTVEQPIVLEGSVLVHHAESLEDEADSLLSRVALDTGEPEWTTALESPVRLQLAHATGDAVILVTVEGELMAFDLDHGEERYRLSL